MKARVKATGEIKEVSRGIYSPYQYVDKEGRIYTEDELEELSEGGGVIFIDDTPDYWTRLEHQYAGMAMQGMSEKYLKNYRDYCAGFGDMDKDEAKATMKDFADAMADVCYYFAHALVEKYKKEERE